MLVFVEGGKPENPEKILRARREPTTNSTHVWHWAGFKLGTLVGSERLHHCTIPAPLS